MKIHILYHPESEFYRMVEEYARDFQNTKGQEVILTSLETKEGSDLAKLYGIVQYPAIVVLRDDGQLVKSWEGTMLPLMQEVASYLIS